MLFLLVQRLLLPKHLPLLLPFVHVESPRSSFEIPQLLISKYDGFLHRVGQKLLVVGYEDEGSRLGRQELFEPNDGFQILIVAACQ